MNAHVKKLWSNKFIRRLCLIGLLFISGVIFFIGPWPTYTSGFERSTYFAASLGELEERVSSPELADERKGFLAGWARRSIVPAAGMPLAGYGARKGAPSTGVRDEVFVKALAVGDGVDVAVIVGSDLLIVPENIADGVRAEIAEQTALSGDEILFNASHNHSGPGGFAPGIVSGIFNGPFDESIPEFLVERFVQAIVASLEAMEPARFTSGGIDVPELIRNRERTSAPVDSELSYLFLEKTSGERCVVVSYSAHPTVVGSENLEITGEYPGFLMTHLEGLGGSEVIYLGGAVGSMGHRAPEADTAFERSEAMGRILAERVANELGFSEAATTSNAWSADLDIDIDVEVIGFPIELPPYQLRVNQHLRLSKHLLPILGIDKDAWLQGLRIGEMIFLGMPADFSGEISVALKERYADSGLDLWVLSFNGDYVGYISPDHYYNDLETDGSLGYERGTMSWIGPKQEAYLTALTEKLVDALF